MSVGLLRRAGSLRVPSPGSHTPAPGVVLHVQQCFPCWALLYCPPHSFGSCLGLGTPGPRSRPTLGAPYSSLRAPGESCQDSLGSGGLHAALSNASSASLPRAHFTAAPFSCHLSLLLPFPAITILMEAFTSVVPAAPKQMQLAFYLPCAWH